MKDIVLLLLMLTIIIMIIQKKFEKKKFKQEPIQQTEYNYTNYDYYPYRMKYLLTQNEFNFYNRLKEITNPLNLQILAKIRLADLIEVDTNQINKKDYVKYFGKIKSKHIDFAICNNMNIIALLELDDSSHNRADRQERDNFVNNALLKAGYTVVRTNGNMDIVMQALYSRGYNVYQYQNINQWNLLSEKTTIKNNRLTKKLKRKK